MNRRSWLRTAAGLLVAPAIVRAESLMRVRPIVVPGSDYASAPVDLMWGGGHSAENVQFPVAGTDWGRFEHLIAYDPRTGKIIADFTPVAPADPLVITCLEPGRDYRITFG